MNAQDDAARLRATARVVGQALLLVAAVDLAGAWLRERASAAIVVQLAIAELGAGRLAIAWSAPDSVAPPIGAVARRAAMGAGLGFAAGVGLVALGRLTRSLSIGLAATHDLWPLGVGLLMAVFAAARDELLLRGLVIRVLAGWSRGGLVVAACALAAGARGWFSEDATPQSIAIAGAAGAALACIWLVDRGAWMAVGANAAWTFWSGSLCSGALLDVRGGAGPWGGGALGLGGGAASALGMAVAAAVAIAWWRRRRQRE